MQHYFGSKNPATLQNNDVVNRKPLAPQIPNNAELTPRSRNYRESSGGVTLNITNLAQNVASIETHRLTEGADLSGILAPVVQNVSLRMNGSTCVITDPGAVEYSVTPYTPTLGNTPVSPNNPTIPTPPLIPGGGAPTGRSVHVVGQEANVFGKPVRIPSQFIPSNIAVNAGSVWTFNIGLGGARIISFTGRLQAHPLRLQYQHGLALARPASR
ncbi:MAG: hypothetical protein AAYR33_08910 [Acetobacteraceae bacterium]